MVMQLLLKQFWQRQKWAFLVLLYFLTVMGDPVLSNQNVFLESNSVQASQVNSNDVNVIEAHRLTSFRKRFFELSKNNLALPKNYEFQNYEYILIAGFGNEFYQKAYFSDMVYALKNNGVSTQQVHIIFPSSLASAKTNGNVKKIVSP